MSIRAFFRNLDWPLVWLGARLAEACGGHHGPLGPFLLDCRVDTWLRHRSAALMVLRALAWVKPRPYPSPFPCVLDVGGSGDLAAFLPPRWQVTTANPDGYHGDRIDGADLPYQSHYFDATVSLDTLEHVPAPKRVRFLAELVRVTRPEGLALAQWPAQDGRDYRAGEADATFQGWHRRLLGSIEPNIAEHEIYGVPAPGAIGSLASGWFGIRHWHWIMWTERLPFVRLLAALYYGLRPEAAEQGPPWYACRVILP